MEQVTCITVEETDEGELIVELEEHSAATVTGSVKSRRIVEPPFGISLKPDHEVKKHGNRRFEVEGKIMAEVNEYEE